MIIEANFGDGMFTKILQPVMLRKHRCLIEEVKHSTQKEARIIDTLEPVMMRHKLVVDPKVIEADYKSTMVHPIDKQNVYLLFYQMSRITKDRGSLAKDDRLDVLAMVIAYWNESMARDQEKVEAEVHGELHGAGLSRHHVGSRSAREGAPGVGLEVVRTWGHPLVGRPVRHEQEAQLTVGVTASHCN